jgi:hypothetical protein
LQTLPVLHREHGPCGNALFNAGDEVVLPTGEECAAAGADVINLLSTCLCIAHTRTLQRGLCQLLELVALLCSTDNELSMVEGYDDARVFCM